MMAGIDYASGSIIVSIDADLQNDPRDIPALLAKMDEGFDVVCGWRKDRQDAAIRRNFVSRVANRIISQISGVRLHDFGCTLKAYRREVVKDVRLYGEMHRFVPIYASWMGARVCEIPVRHHARKFGKSKYGLERILKVMLDLVVVKFLDRYLVKPIYVFGGFGLLSLLISFLLTGVNDLVEVFRRRFDDPNPASAFGCADVPRRCSEHPFGIDRGDTGTHLFRSTRTACVQRSRHHQLPKRLIDVRYCRFRWTRKRVRPESDDSRACSSRA